jgi:DNA-binding transcriptional ArsR family regulator
MSAATLEAPPGLGALQQKAAEAARLLRLLGNGNRLLLLCHLAEAGEMTVGALAEAVGLSQPALSQHLAMLREDGLVATRKASQAVFYRLDDPKAARVLALLRDLYCPAPC